MYLCYSLAHEVALLGELSCILVTRYVALLPSITVQGIEYVSIILHGKARTQLPLMTSEPFLCRMFEQPLQDFKEPSKVLLSQRNGTAGICPCKQQLTGQRPNGQVAWQSLF